MATFAVFDSLRDKDLSEHLTLVDAYREIDRLSEIHGAGRFSVRLARVHRSGVERREQENQKTNYLLPS
ncbi:MAG TPA: hypothetical protein VKQ73_17330 [Stellaceae bacterium]|nr:hypothetical protein [Stellaceae bacterium]